MVYYAKVTYGVPYSVYASRQCTRAHIYNTCVIECEICALNMHAMAESPVMPPRAKKARRQFHFSET